MLLPTDDETAISPKPLRATITEVMRSGMEVPAARAVKPITSGGMRNVSPITVAHHTIRYEYAAIHRMLPRNVTGKNFLPTNIHKTIQFKSTYIVHSLKKRLHNNWKKYNIIHLEGFITQNILLQRWNFTKIMQLHLKEV